jgi:hypothetical protein
MRVPFRALLVPLLLALAAGFAGCGNRPKLVQVTGKVVHKGQPLTAGSIYFHPVGGSPREGEKSSSLLQLDGSFRAKTFPYGDGLPPGPYKVTLSPDLANRVRLPAYADPARTPWQIVVPDDGLPDHDLEVK